MRTRVVVGTLLVLLLVGSFAPFVSISATGTLGASRHGDFDMIVGCWDSDINGLGDVLGYRNVGPSTTPSWQLESSWGIYDVFGDSHRASPALADLDNDGDYDLLVSNARYVPPMGYRNNGSKTHPIWQRFPAWDVPSLDGYEQNPALADLDNDGDCDLVVGNSYFSAAFFENTGNGTSPQWTRRSEWDFVPGVHWPCPTFADLDNDGDYDLMFGAFDEDYVVVWENNGTATNSSWVRRPAWEWDLTGLPANCHKKPALVDLDGDGDYDLMIGVGDPYRNITAYENTGYLPPNTVWTRKTEWDISLPNMAWIRPAYADLDNRPVHNMDTGLDYWDIQAAINAAETLDGHTIVVNYGDYWPIHVYKELNILGADPEVCSIKCNISYSVVKITSNSVNVTGFTIQTETGLLGFSLETVNNCRIWGNHIVGDGAGIYLQGSSGNTISDNIVECRHNAICILDFSSHNTVSNNSLLYNKYGIQIHNSSNYNLLHENFIDASTWCGIRLNWLGAGFLPVEYNNMTQNLIRGCKVGILLDHPSTENIVLRTRLVGNQYGIHLRQTENNTIAHNIIKENDYYGVYCESSNGNLIYDNFLKNTNNAWDNGVNAWNISDPTLVGYWSLDEGSGSLTHDSSGSGNHGAFDGPTWTSGKYGRALSFDGLDDYDEIPENDLLDPGTGDFTVEAWIKTSSISSWTIISKWSGSGFGDAWWLGNHYYDDIHHLKFSVYCPEMNWAENTTLTVTDNCWHHFTGVRDEGTLRLYIDGVEAASAIACGSVDVDNDEPVRLGNYAPGPGAWYFNGTIDEVRIYRRALNSSEIFQQFAFGAAQNIVGGPLVRGNYWSDNPNPVDIDDDGIGDVPYAGAGSSFVDYLPLVPKWPRIEEFKNVTIFKNGTASVAMWLNVSDSPMAEMYRTMLEGETLVPDHPTPIPEFKKVTSNIGWGENVTVEREFNASEMWLPVRDEFLKSIEEEQNTTLGLKLEITNSSMMDDSTTREFKVWMNGYALLQIVDVTSTVGGYKWEIVIGPVNDNASAVAACLLAVKIEFAQDMLLSLNGMQEFEGTYTTRINLPREATLLEPSKLDGLSWEIDLGSQTRIGASVSLDGPSTVVLTETLVATEQNITMSLKDFVESYVKKGYKTVRINMTMPKEPIPISPFDFPDWNYKFEKRWHWTIWTAQMRVNLGNKDYGASLIITPSISHSGYIGAGAHGKGWSLKYYWIKASLTLTASVNIEAKAWAKVAYADRWDIEIFTLRVPHIIDTSCFGIPFWADLNFRVVAYAYYDAKGKITVEFTAKYSKSFTVGVDWKSNRSPRWKWIKDVDQAQSKNGPTIDIEGSVEVGAGIKGRLELLLYSVAGPFGELELYGKARFTYDSNGTCNSHWKIEVGLAASAGVTINIKVKIWRWKKKFSKEWSWGPWTLLSKDWQGDMFCGPVPPPVAKFTYSPTLPVAYISTVRFNGSESYAPEDSRCPNREISKYEWTFTAVCESQSAPPSQTGDVVYATFETGGWYVVALTVTDDCTYQGPPPGPYTGTKSEVIYILKRDIAVVDVSVSTNYTYPGWPVRIKTTVENLGDITESFNVSILYGMYPCHVHGFGWELVNLNVTDLPPGQTTTLKWIWDSTGVPEGANFTVWAIAGGIKDSAPYTAKCPQPLPGEPLPADNNKHQDGLVHVRIPGDTDGDGDVDIYDVVKMCSCYGYELGDPQYIASCDVDGDGDIDIYDIVILCSHYGETAL